MSAESPQLRCDIHLISGEAVQVAGSADVVAIKLDQYPDACCIVVHMNGGVGTANGNDPRAHWLLRAIIRAFENLESSLYPRPELGVPHWQSVV